MEANASRTMPADLRSLTSFRFFAALWVVFFHFGDQLPLSFWRSNPILHGTRAVDFFFILSGFILAHVYGPRIMAGRFDMRDFLIKRLARLYPVHLLTLFGSLAIFVLARAAGVQLNNPDKYDMHQLIPNLLLIQVWFPFTHEAFNMPSWSISAEFAAYLLFPAIGAAILTRGRHAWPWLGATVVLFAVMGFLSQAILHTELLRLIHLGVFRIIPLFILGVVLWKGWIERVFVIRRWVLLPAAIGAFALARYPFAVVPIFSLIILAGAEQDIKGKAGIFDTGWLVFLGEASFSLYMTHGLLQTVYFAALKKLHLPVDNLPFALAAFAAAIIVSVIVSMLVYRFVEAPCRDAITRWHAIRSRTPETTVVI